MKKHLILCLSLVLCPVIKSQAQFSAGVMAGAGHLYQRQEVSATSRIIGVDPAQPLLMAGVYGQVNQKGIRGFIAGLQLRYQSQQQAQRFAIPPKTPTDPVELTTPEYTRYSYLVATPYVGIRPFGQLEITAGPEASLLLNSKLTNPDAFNRIFNGLLFGYNLKATYWFGQLGIEGGYSKQNTAYYYGGGSYKFYNSYVYGAVKYNLFKQFR